VRYKQDLNEIIKMKMTEEERNTLCTYIGVMLGVLLVLIIMWLFGCGNDFCNRESEGESERDSQQERIETKEHVGRSSFTKNSIWDNETCERVFGMKGST